MALSEATLAGLIKSELELAFDIKDAAILQKFADAVAKAVVDHITTDGECEVSGVQSGGDTVTGSIL